MIPRFVERFPKYGNIVLNAVAQDSVMAELCEDYDTVVEALEIEEARSDTKDGVPQETYRELVRLKRELEYELLERLATSDEEEVGS